MPSVDPCERFSLLGMCRTSAFHPRGLTSTIDLRGLPKGRFTVTVTVQTTVGKRFTETRRYRTCATKSKRRR